MLGELTMEQVGWLAGAIAVRLLWQGVIVGLVTACALALLRRRGPRTAYAIVCTALFAFALLLPLNLAYGPVPPPPSMATSYALAPSALESAGATSSLSSATTAIVSNEKPVPLSPTSLIPLRGERPRPVVAAWYEAALPWLGASWALGTVLFALYDVLGLLTVARLRHRGISAPADLLILAERVRLRVGVYSEVPIRVVEGISTAMVTGLFRMVILVPASMLSGMSPEAVEVILAHEFAHLRRWDRWINLLQCILESLLFFHPALWWVSRRVRIERELCCDELALKICPDRALYVRALLSLSDCTTNLSAVALSSHGGNLAGRVRHILGLPQRPTRLGRAGGSITVLAVLALVVGLVIWSRTSSASERTGAALHFSDLRSIGMVQARWEDDLRPMGTPWLAEYTTGWTVLDEARGEVKVPRGAQVKLSIARTDLSGLRDFPPDAIYFLDARYRDLTDNDLAPIGHLSGLRALDLGENLYNLHGPGLATLSNLKDLEWLNIHGSPVESLPENAIRQFPRLQYLAGIFREHTGQALREAADLEYLEYLSMKSGGPVLADDLGRLSGKASLRGLALYNLGLTDEVVGALVAIPNLAYLNLSENKLGDGAMATIAQMTELRHLDLHNTGITDAGVTHLSSLKQLETINLSFTSITEACFASLDEMPSLRAVNFIGTQVSDTAAAAFMQRLAQGSTPDGPVQHSSNPDAPRIGLLMSHFTRTGPTMPDYLYGNYTYGNQESATLANALNEANFDVYAIIEPGTEFLGELPLILQDAGLATKLVDGTRAAALLELDAVLTCAAFNLSGELLAAFGEAIEGGLGLVSIAAFGDNLPGSFDSRVTALTGLHGSEYVNQGCQDSTVTVLQGHPIFGNTAIGTAGNVRTLVGPAGAIDGAVLLGAPSNYPDDFPALYVRNHGAGRIVRAQWHHPMQPGLPFPGHTLYIRALNWAAGREADTVW